MVSTLLAAKHVRCAQHGQHMWRNHINCLPPLPDPTSVTSTVRSRAHSLRRAVVCLMAVRKDCGLNSLHQVDGGGSAVGGLRLAQQTHGSS